MRRLVAVLASLLWLFASAASAAPAPWRLAFNTRPPGPSVTLMLPSTSPLWRALGVRVPPGLVPVRLGTSPLEPLQMAPVTVGGRDVKVVDLLRGVVDAGDPVRVSLEVRGSAPTVVTLPASSFGPGDRWLPAPAWSPGMSAEAREEALEAGAVRLGADIVVLVIDSDPSGAEVFVDRGRDLSYLGRAGTRLSFDRGALRAAGGEQGNDIAKLVLRLPLHADTRVDVPLGGLRPGEEVRRAVALVPRLGPLSAMGVAAWRHPLVAAAMGLLVIGGVCGAVGWRRRVAREAADVEAYRRLAAGADRSDPLVRDQAEMGGYKIIDRLGSGGMATVYLAIAMDAVDARRMWALKLMHAELSSDPEFRARFQREARHSRELRHPNIVRTVHDGEYDGHLYIVMEYVEGETLAVRAGGVQLAPAEALRLLTPICEAVAFAHSKGIVHRDLKPENVMIDARGTPKIMDFGLARSEADLTKVTQSGSALGTPAYMPPEQLEARGLDPRSDQYSLGVMTFELLTGRLPFLADEPLVMAMMHLTETPPTVSSVCPGLPPGIDAVVGRMLEKQPQDRYGSVTEALRDLTRALRK